MGTNLRRRWAMRACLALALTLCVVGSSVAGHPAAPLGSFSGSVSTATSGALAVQVTPVSATKGTMFRIDGAGFQADEDVTFSISGPDDYAGTSQTTANSQGVMVLFWDSSHQASGVYQLSAEGDEGSSAQAAWVVRSRVICSKSDGFDADSLAPEWSWVREDETHWSLTEHPGLLRMQTQAGTLTGAANDQRNLLIREAPSGNYRVTTQVEVHADQNYQHAGLYLYEDDDHYVRLTRAQSTQSAGQGIYFSVEAGSTYTATAVTDAAGVAYLKLGRRDDVFAGFYSQDGTLWYLVGQREVMGFRPSYVGISAANGNASYATEIPADFEWLRVDELCSEVTLPTIMKAHALEGQLIINEVMPQPASGESEWVELLNIGPGPLDIRGYEVTDEDGNDYTIPLGLPEVPNDGFVLIYFDGLGAGADDYDFSDSLAVLHSPSGLVDVFEDDIDQVALYSGSTRSAETIVSFMAYGGSPGTEAANASQAKLWGEYWFAHREPGVITENGQMDFDFSGYSMGLFPGSRLNIPSRWATYDPEDVTPGVPNEVAPVPWYDPPDGSAVDGATLQMTWQGVPSAAGYDFQLDESSDFQGPLVSERLTEPWWNTNQSFDEGTYYWRVRVVGNTGRTGRWLGPLSIEVRDLSTTSTSNLLTDTILNVIRLQQRKDTHLLCLDGDHRHGVDDPWDMPHPTTSWRIHARNNCCRACIAMINHYYGGNISQDYLAYVEYENWGNSLRWGSDGDPSVGHPALDLGHDSPSGPGSTELAAWAWGVSLDALEVLSYKPNFSWISDCCSRARLTSMRISSSMMGLVR